MELVPKTATPTSKQKKICKVCGLKVNKKGFLINGQDLYCEMDYKRKFSPRCEECSDFIFGVSRIRNFVLTRFFKSFFSDKLYSYDLVVSRSAIKWNNNNLGAQKTQERKRAEVVKYRSGEMQKRKNT